MRLIPRRKRTWLLVLLGVAIVGAAGIWWSALSKSEFERKYDQLKLGMSYEESTSIVVTDPARQLLAFAHKRQRFAWVDDGEVITLDFENDRLTRTQFKPAGAIERLGQLWFRCFNSAPPF
jgi:hypothetical protein